MEKAPPLAAVAAADCSEHLAELVKAACLKEIEHDFYLLMNFPSGDIKIISHQAVYFNAKILALREGLSGVIYLFSRMYRSASSRLPWRYPL